MSYLAKGDELFDLGENIYAQHARWSEALQSLQEAAGALAGTNNLEGNTADNMKNYLNYVYTTIQAGFNAVLTDYLGNWRLYFGDYSNVDSDAHFVIDTAELDRIDQGLDSECSAKGFVEEEVNAAISSVSDITSAGFGGLGYIQQIHNTTHSELDTLKNEVCEVEASHASNDFSKIDSGLDQLEAMLNEMLGNDMIYKLGFDVGAFASSAAYQNLAKAYGEIMEDVSGKSDKIQAAGDARKKHIDQLTEEAERRREEAERAKTAVLVGTIILGTVVSVATAGMGTGVVIAATAAAGGVSGALVAGVNTAADMYASGGWDAVEWGQVGKNALIGGIKGTIAGAVSGSLSSLSTTAGNFIIGETPGTLTKVAYNALSGGVTKVVNGEVDRFNSALFEGEGVKTALNKAFDRDKILGDAIAGSTKAIVSTVADTGFSNFSKSHAGSYTPQQSIAINAIFGGVSEAGAGATSRFVKTYATTGDLDESWRSATDKRELAIDAATGAASRGSQEYIKQKPRIEAQKFAEEEARRFNLEKNGRDTLETLEADGIHGVKRTKTGNLDYSNATYKNGKDVIYKKDGIPAEVEIKMVDGNAQGSDKTAFQNAYREKINDPNWKIPKGYTIQHGDTQINADGTITCKTQLVPKSVHEGYPHSGGAAQQRNYVEKIAEYGGAAAPQKKVEGTNMNDAFKDDLSAYDDAHGAGGTKAVSKVFKLTKDYGTSDDEGPEAYSDPYGGITISMPV